MQITTFRAITVSAPSLPANPAGGAEIQAALTTVSGDALANEEVLVRIEYSSINYKDVMAVQAHPGVSSRTYR